MHLGTVLRHLAYTAFALHGCLESHVQVCSTNVQNFKCFIGVFRVAGGDVQFVGN